MYEIHFTDNTGIKDINHRADVRMNVMIQRNQGRKVERIELNGQDVTTEMIQGLPI